VFRAAAKKKTAGLIEKETDEHRTSNECILPVMSLYVEWSVLKRFSEAIPQIFNLQSSIFNLVPARPG
jgi:hypothetical protein